MKKIISFILCILLMVSSAVPCVYSSEDIVLSIIAEQNPVDNTRSDLIVTNFSGKALTPDNGKYSQSGTPGVDGNNNHGNHAIGFRFVESDVEDVNNVVYTASFDIHNDMERDVTVSLIRKNGDKGKSVLTFKKLNTGVRIYDATSNNTKFIESSYVDGKASCTIAYNAKTKVLTAGAGDKILTIENIEVETGAEYTTFRCKISDSLWSQHQGAAEQFTVSDVAMKMEKISEPEITGPIAEQNPVDNTHSDLKVTAFSATAELTPEKGKYSQSGTVDTPENVAIGFKFNTNNIQDANNVVYTTSFKIHDDMGVDVTASLIRKSGTTGKHVLTFKKLNTGVRIYDATSNNTNYIDSSYSDGKAPCTVTYNAKTSVLTVQAGDKILTINDIAPETDGQYTTLRCKIGVSTTASGGAAEKFTVSDVAMKMEDADNIAPPTGDDDSGDDDGNDDGGNDDGSNGDSGDDGNDGNDDKPEETGPIAENKNITEAATGDLQVIQWQQGTLSTDNGKFTLDTIGSGINRGIFLGLPKNSSIKDTIDMTKVVYTASFKLHRDDRVGNFTVQVMGYHSSSVESSGIVFMNDEKDGMLWVNSNVGSGTTEWNQDGTVDCTLTYNAETKMVTVKVGEIKLSNTLSGDYNPSNAAAAYGFRMTGQTDRDTKITISDVSLKLEKAVAPPPSVDVDGVKGKTFKADMDNTNPVAINGANGFSFCGRVNGVDTKMVRVEQNPTTHKYGWASATDPDAKFTFNGPQAIPTDDTAAVIVFDAPGSGFAQISVPTFQNPSWSSKGKVTVELNGKTLWTHNFPKNNTTTSIDFTMYLNKGDKLAFVVERIGGTQLVTATLPMVRYLTDSEIEDASLEEDAIKTFYNAKTDYGKMHNVAGVTSWSYVTKTDGVYNDMYYNNTFSRWIPSEKTDLNTEFKGGITKQKTVVPYGTYARAWTADKSGVVRLSSDNGVTADKDVLVTVLKNGNEMLWKKAVTAGDDADKTLDKTIQVEVGDIIYFEVQNDSSDLASVYWTPQVEYIQTAVFVQDGIKIDEIKDLDESKEISCYYVDSDKTAGKAFLVAYDNKGTAVGIKEQGVTFTGENMVELTFPAFGEDIEPSQVSLIILTNEDGRYYAVNKAFNMMID